MGVREDTLRRIFQKLGLSLTSGRLPFPYRDDVAASPYAAEVQRIYKALGGIQPVFPLNLRSWDLEIGELAVELDEDLHFNRYRKMTLGATTYQELPSFPHDNYLRYCAQYEAVCLRAGGYGGKWSNPSCEQQFGPASPPKILTGNGAPRWKQRAFYDFVKDLSPLIIGVPVVRLAIWDTVYVGDSEMSVEEVLSIRSPGVGEALYELVKQRSSLT